MIQNVLRAIGGIGVYDAISICLFMFVFSCVLVWAARLRKPYLQTMSSLPLREDAPAEKGEDSHE